jgi:hypothetical protein
MARDMAALVAQTVKGDKKGNRAKEIAHYNEWPKCSHAGCPLQTTIKAETVTCLYHYREHGYSAECITEAVKEFEGYLKKYGQMIYWNVRTWKEKRAQIMGWDVLPATEFEMTFPSAYLIRFKKWIDMSVVERASEIYEHGE